MCKQIGALAAAACAGDSRFADVDSVRDAVPLVAFGCMACPVKVAARCGEVAEEVGASVGLWDGRLHGYGRKPRDLRAQAMALLSDEKKAAGLRERYAVPAAPTLTDAQRDEITQLLELGESASEIARAYGITRDVVNGLKRRLAAHTAA